MSIRRNCLIASLGVLLMATSPAWSQSLLKSLDPDNDGTVDLAEAKAAASKVFDKLDGDHDGTLDKRELRGRISGKELSAADPDKDGTLDKDEYLVVVEQHFKKADPDNDGTVDARISMPCNEGVKSAEIAFAENQNCRDHRVPIG